MIKIWPPYERWLKKKTYYNHRTHYYHILSYFFYESMQEDCCIYFLLSFFRLLYLKYSIFLLSLAASLVLYFVVVLVFSTLQNFYTFESRFCSSLRITAMPWLPVVCKFFVLDCIICYCMQFTLKNTGNYKIC